MSHSENKLKNKCQIAYLKDTLDVLSYLKTSDPTCIITPGDTYEVIDVDEIEHDKIKEEPGKFKYDKDTKKFKQKDI